MRNKRVVFVLGAGASRPFGFPTGVGLKEKICGYLVPNDAAFNGYLFSRFENKTILEMREKLLDTPLISIDRFLANHKDNSEMVKIGKMCIAYAINSHEDGAFLRQKNANWYDNLFGKMLELANHEPSQIEQLPIDIVTFNYDRSFEYFIYKAFLNTFNIDQKIAKEYAASFIQKRVHHIHGSLGNVFENEYVSVGRNFEVLEKMASNIRIVHEDNLEEVIELAGHALTNSQIVYFIGFGFASDNIKKLRFTKNGEKMRQMIVKASRFNTRGAELSDIKETFTNETGLRIELFENLREGMEPIEFFRECISLA